MKKRIEIIAALVLLVGCVQESSEASITLMKDFNERQMTQSADLYQGRVYIPYPLVMHYGEIGVPYGIAIYEDQKMRLVNDDPGNLCNKTDASVCTSFNDGWIESLFVTPSYIISVEDALGSSEFETYLTIKNHDGSNRKDILQLKENANPLQDFQIKGDDFKLFFIFEDNLHEYDVKTDKLTNLTKDLKIRSLNNLNYIDNMVYFYAAYYEEDNQNLVNSIITYDEKFEVKVSNLEKQVLRIFDNKYFVRRDRDDEFSETFINYYNDEDLLIESENQGLASILSVNDTVIIYETQYQNDQPEHYIRLYEDSEAGLNLLDSLKIEEEGLFFLQSLEENRILFARASDIETGLYMEAIVIDIIDQRLIQTARYPYERR